MIHRNFRFGSLSPLLLTAMSLAAVLTSCAAPTPREPADHAASDRGYLHVRLPLGVDPNALLLKSTSDGADVRLARKGSQVAGRWLPPGEYAVASWHGIPCEGYPPIRVAAGRVTDMGALFPVPIGGYDFVLLPVSDAETRAYAASLIQDLGPNLRSAESIEWRVGVPPKPLTLQSNATAGVDERR